MRSAYLYFPHSSDRGLCLREQTTTSLWGSRAAAYLNAPMTSGFPPPALKNITATSFAQSPALTSSSGVTAFATLPVIPWCRAAA